MRQRCTGPLIREIPEKSHDPNPAEIMLLGAIDDLLKIKTWAKMHQTMQTVLFTFFCSCYTILLISLLLEKKHAATLHGTTSGDLNPQPPHRCATKKVYIICMRNE